MTDHDAPEPHPVDDPLADALRRAERRAGRNHGDDTPTSAVTRVGVTDD